MSRRLKDLIEDVRSCKTASLEREIVAKELAAIRTSFKKDESEYRQRSMAKLIYLHTLGYPTTFAQMECLKLVVSPYYSDKRIGYLGLMLLMDEKQEILMLVTNSLKNDLIHPNHFIVGLALCALANISSAEMCRDCSPDIEKLLVSANPYIKKKAALCAVRICRKVPDLRENYEALARDLIEEKNHGVKITGITLLTELLERNPALVPQYRDLVPLLVRTLKSLSVSGYAPEYDVSGVTDPFLQTRILRLLRMLGARDAKASEDMNDVLAQVATNTETVRNVGNAILYEAVQTIMTIKSETGLKVLAINTLGKFLANKDNNIRYVALNTLSKVVNHDIHAVQRHRNTIVDCLKDTDVSIRRRALDLVYALVNAQNVRILVRELLNFLLVSDVQFRPELTAKLCAVAERHAPNQRWHIDTMLRIITLAGAYVPESVPNSLIFQMGNTPELHQYAAHRMYDALVRNEAARHDTLTIVGVWCVGEYADLLIAAPQPPLDPSSPRITEDDVLALLSGIASHAAATSNKSNALSPSGPAGAMHSDGGARVRAYVTTALVKLTTRFSAAAQPRISEMLERYANHIDVEVQQRAVEYLILAKQSDDIKREVTQRMPVLDEEQMKARGLVEKPIGQEDAADDEDDEDVGNTPSPSSAPTPVAPVAAPAGLIDLDDVFGGPAPTATPSAPTATAGLDDIFGAPALTPSTGRSGGVDLLGGMDDLLGGPVPMPSSGGGTDLLGGDLLGGDLLGGGGSAPTSGGAAPVAGMDLLGGMGASGMSASGMGSGMASGMSAGGMDLFGAPSQPSQPAARPTPAGEVQAFAAAGVRITFATQKHPTNPSLSMVRATFHNDTAAPVTNFSMQVAVPKYIKLQLDPATGNVLPPVSSSVTQVMKLANGQHGVHPLVLKIKVDFSGHSSLVDFTFP